MVHSLAFYFSLLLLATDSNKHDLIHTDIVLYLLFYFFIFLCSFLSGAVWRMGFWRVSYSFCLCRYYFLCAHKGKVLLGHNYSLLPLKDI